jgi:two-component system, LytTR family, sensor kinase
VPPTRHVPLRFIVAVWTLPALADLADTYVTTAVHGAHPNVLRIALLIVPGWYIWAALTPFILWLGQRYPKSIALHIAASIAAVLIHVGVLSLTGRLFDPTEQFVSGRIHYADALANWAPISMLTFWATVIAGRALTSMWRASALSQELAATQLAALRAQLHPHFLFNTLNTVVSLVRVGKSDDSVRVLTNLSDLLRHMLRDASTHEVPLRDEIALLERYLDIERVRFENSLSVGYAVDDALLDALVPSLILQPLVENAIRHGKPATVAIQASASGATLALHVKDDGPGLPRDFDAARCVGVGLRNTRARLAGLYGAAADLRLTPEPYGGVDASVTLPLRFAGDA